MKALFKFGFMTGAMEIAHPSMYYRDPVESKMQSMSVTGINPTRQYYIDFYLLGIVRGTAIYEQCDVGEFTWLTVEDVEELNSIMDKEV